MGSATIQPGIQYYPHYSRLAEFCVSAIVDLTIVYKYMYPSFVVVVACFETVTVS